MIAHEGKNIYIKNVHWILLYHNFCGSLRVLITFHFQKEPYAFFVCGDHGMSDGGGHGGASHSEIMTSGLLISSLFNQSDQITNEM